MACGVYVLSHRTAKEAPPRATKPTAAPAETAQPEKPVAEKRPSLKVVQLNDALSASNLEASKNIFGSLSPDDTAGLDLEQVRGRIAILQRQYDALMTEANNQLRTGRWDEAKSSLKSMERMNPSDSRLPSLKAEIDDKMANSERSKVDSSSLSSTLKALENTREP